MKKKVISIVLLVLFLACIVAIIAGFVLKLSYLWITGIVVMSALFLVFSLVRLVKLFRTAKKIVEDEYDAEATEMMLNSKVNVTKGIENRENYAIKMFVSIIRAYKSSNFLGKIKSAGLVLVVLALMISFIVLTALDLTEWALVVWGSVAVLLISIMVFAKISEKKVLRKKDNREYDDQNYVKTTGLVKECNLFSEKYFVKRHMSPFEKERRIASTAYKIKLDISGKEGVTYSKEYYNKGEVLNIVYEKKSFTIMILGKSNANRDE